MKGILVCVALLLLWTSVGAASDHANLEENIPTQMEDAYASERGSREFQAVVTYADEGSEHRMIYIPTLELGVLPRTQLDLSATFYTGSAERTGSGDVGVELLHNFNAESTVVPATALVVGAGFPAGENSGGVDLTAKLILTKKVFPQATLPHGMHVNLAWTRNAGRDREAERRDLFTWILGFSVTTGKDTTLLMDYVREQMEEKHQEGNLVEAGIRHALGHSYMFTAGAGVGLGADSEDYRLTVSLHYEF